MEQQVSLADPRLLTSKKLRKSSVIDKYAGIQHRFQPHTKAIEMVRNVNLKGKTALITGANSGLGKNFVLLVYCYLNVAVCTQCNICFYLLSVFKIYM